MSEHLTITGATQYDARRDPRISAGATMTDAPQRPAAPITNGVESIAEEVSILEKQIASLESRLGPALAPPMPADPKEPARRQASCDLDDRIIGILSHLVRLRVAVDSLTSRVRL